MKLRNPQVLRELTKPGTQRLLSIPQLAKDASISPGMIYHLLNGKSAVSPQVAQRIAEAVGVKLRVLFLDNSPSDARRRLDD